MRRILLIFFLIFLAAPTLAATFTVTNCAAAKDTYGSLAWAIEQARLASLPEDRVVDFNISTAEAGYITTEVTGVGFWRIRPDDTYPFDLNMDNIQVRGSTQSLNQGDTNPFGPEIEIDGTNLSASNPLFKIDLNNDCTIEGLVLNKSKTHAVYITGGNKNHIYGCYIGTNITGEVAAANIGSGIYLERGDGSTIGGNTAALRNIISGNLQHGTELNNSTATQVLNNYIGINRTGSRALANSNSGIALTNNAGLNGANFIGSSSDMGRNIISGNAQYGVEINSAFTNQILNNYVGTDTTEAGNLGNTSHGIYLHNGARSQYIASRNIIAFNSGDGVRIDGSTTYSNTLTQNSFFQNTGQGIRLSNSANGGIQIPTIATSEYFSPPFGLLYVQGGGPASAIIELMKIATPETEAAGEGKATLGFAEADANGNWFVYLPTGEAQPGDKITALATDRNGNTSEFAQNLSTVVGTVIYRPDGMIGLVSDSTDYIGEDVFNTTGSNQTKSKDIYNTQAAIYYIKVKNAGNISPDSVRITGTGDSSDWQIKYYDAKTEGNDITTQVTGSGYITSSILASGSFECRAEVISTGSTLSTKEVFVTLASDSNTSRLDVVKAVTVAAPAAPTDAYHFEISAPASAEAGKEFQVIITARNAAGQVTTEVVGKTHLTVDYGTISVTSLDATAFSQEGIWSGMISLSNVGTRTLWVKNDYITSTATALIEVVVPPEILSGGLSRFGPNPYDPTSGQPAVFWYWLNENKTTSIFIFDLQGSLLWKQTYIAGSQGGRSGVNAITWDGKNNFGEILPNGIYFFRIVQGSKIIYKSKLIILR